MAKQRPRWTSADEKRMRQWRSCGVVILVGVLLLVALYVTLKFFRHTDHAHKPAPHGGVIVSVEEGGDHYHVEAVVEKGGTLKLYTFGEEVSQGLEVESQVLAAQLRREADGEFMPVDLVPLPQPSEPEGKTSQFFGKLPQGLQGSPLVVRIASIEMGGKRFPLVFVIPASAGGGADDQTEEKLYLTAGGKYGEEDIAANGRQTASARYKVFRAEHNTWPKRGDRICPVTRFLANRRFTWVVSGKTYEFCCPPCIDQFVRRAKGQPQAIRDPEEYVKK